MLALFGAALQEERPTGLSQMIVPGFEAIHSLGGRVTLSIQVHRRVIVHMYAASLKCERTWIPPVENTSKPHNLANRLPNEAAPHSWQGTLKLSQRKMVIVTLAGIL